jgi:DNA-binding transcriptional regulator/RsmH inhibitor MraZ
MNRRDFIKGLIGTGITLSQIDLASDFLADSMLSMDFEPYSSSYVDSSGRAVVPYSLRKILNNSKRLYIYDGFGPHLVISTEDKLNDRKRRLLSHSRDHSKEVKQLMFFLSSAKETKMDGKGRIFIPEASREYAGIKNNSEIIIEESNDKVLIWARPNYVIASPDLSR